MKVLLIYARFNQDVSYRVPLGIAYIGAVLRKNNVKAVLREGALYRSWENFKKDLAKIKPDIVGISLSSFLIQNAFNYAKATKEVLPDAKVVFGGPHASVMMKEILKDKSVDIVVYGEGEETFLDLAKDKPLKDILGIVYRDKGKIIENKPRPFIDMDSRPMPARELLPINLYLHTRPTMPLPYPATDVEASRGCFGNCIYCQPVLRKMFGMKIRQRNYKKAVDEMEYLIKKYKVKGIMLGNDEPLVNKYWVRNFCDEIIKRKIKVKIMAANRVDTVDLETMKKMKKAGFIKLSFGVESGSQKMLDFMRKGVRVEQIHEAFRICSKVGIAARANLMVGTPGETNETIEDTIKLIKKIKPDFVYLAATCPTPGSDLYDYAKEKGMLASDNICSYKAFDAGHLNLPTMSTDEIYDSIQKISKIYKLLLLSYFFNPIRFWKKRHLIKIILYYYWRLLRSPRQLVRAFSYYSKYGKHIKKVK